MTDHAQFEMRTYTSPEGKLDALLARFRDHTVEIFATHNMQSVGYWVLADTPETLVYILRHTGDPEANWDAFRADPDWIAAKAASEVDGPIVSHLESVFMTATDFSAIS